MRHFDEPILLIAAASKGQLEAAARHIQIEYEELPPVLTIQESLTGAEVLYGNDNVFKRFLIGRVTSTRVRRGRSNHRGRVSSAHQSSSTSNLRE